MSKGNKLYVQFGCGLCAPEGWLNFDSSPTLRFERIPILGLLYTRNSARFPENVRYGDAVKGLPVTESSCDAVYCSHVLEHLALEDCRRALKNTYFALKPGGTFRMVLPDLEYLIESYKNDCTPEAAMIFMKESYLGQTERMQGLRGFLVSWLGGSRHYWMWDYKALEQELARAGFVDIRRAYYHDSQDGRFNEVEDKGRWDGCLGIECRKGES